MNFEDDVQSGKARKLVLPRKDKKKMQCSARLQITLRMRFRPDTPTQMPREREENLRHLYV